MSSCSQGWRFIDPGTGTSGDGPTGPTGPTGPACPTGAELGPTGATGTFYAHVIEIAYPR